MFNFQVRKNAIENLEKAVRRHELVREDTQRASVGLFEQRKRAASDVIEHVEAFVNRLANSPKEFAKSVADLRVAAGRFDEAVRQFEAEAAKTTRVGSATGVAGTAAGVGVAAFGPTAALAVATTFGTASTGTAISALSGAAATNAALAWLGGGALAAGGGGMVAGQTLLALAGPIGWTIGGVALVGSGVYLNYRNAHLAKEAIENRMKVEGEIRSLQAATLEIRRLSGLTKDHSEGCLGDLSWLQEHAPANYKQFNREQKERLAALINHIRSLGELLQSEVSYAQ